MFLCDGPSLIFFVECAEIDREHGGRPERERHSTGDSRANRSWAQVESMVLGSWSLERVRLRVGMRKQGEAKGTVGTCGGTKDPELLQSLRTKVLPTFASQPRPLRTSSRRAEASC